MVDSWSCSLWFIEKSFSWLSSICSHRQCIWGSRQRNVHDLIYTMVGSFVRRLVWQLDTWRGDYRVLDRILRSWWIVCRNALTIDQYNNDSFWCAMSSFSTRNSRYAFHRIQRSSLLRMRDQYLILFKKFSGNSAYVPRYIKDMLSLIKGWLLVHFLNIIRAYFEFVVYEERLHRARDKATYYLAS